MAKKPRDKRYFDGPYIIDVVNRYNDRRVFKLLSENDNEEQEVIPWFDLESNMAYTLKNYFEHGLHPGGFTSAFLSGNLFAAIQRADTNNGIPENFFFLALWVTRNLPSECYGSPEIMQEWIKIGGITKYEQKLAEARGLHTQN